MAYSKNISKIIQVVLPVPLRSTFDYLARPEWHAEDLKPGIRLLVPFQRRQLVGILIAVSDVSTLPFNRIREAEAILDQMPIISDEIIQLGRWASDYYHYSLGEILVGTLPTVLRKGHKAELDKTTYFSISDEGKKQLLNGQIRARKQKALLDLLMQCDGKVSEQAIRSKQFTTAIIKNLSEKEWIVEEKIITIGVRDLKINASIEPNAEQKNVIEKITKNLDQFSSYLLDGITGSGKTEVYLQVIAAVLSKGKQALVLVPEINLTPQMLQRFKDRFQADLVVLHSGLSEKERSQAWLSAKEGRAHIVIGTRSAVFVPLTRLGIIIVDEEHDMSFKQQDGFRYSARDIAVIRGNIANIPIVLGSATPALESLYNVQRGRYQRLLLPKRAGGAMPPSYQIIDIRRQQLVGGLSPTLIKLVEAHLVKGEQVLLFINRRGYAPGLVCHHCGWYAECRHCDSKLILHQAPSRLQCHHCGSVHRIFNQCPDCQNKQLIPQGAGTQRLEEALQKLFPRYSILRVDSDTTRKKGLLQKHIDAITRGEAQLVVGTQMLAKGHHFPNLTLVVIVDADSGLFSVDFRASERMGQLLMQVAGRAGRTDKPGQVVIQTRHPEHPLLQELLKKGYSSFSQTMLLERQEACLPPFSYLAMVRMEGVDKKQVMNCLDEIYQYAQAIGMKNLEIFPPVPAPMERRAGRFRGQLMLLSTNRGVLQQLLSKLTPKIEKSKLAQRLRWSLDVDPQEIY